MYELTAHFYPFNEPQNGCIGKVTIVVGHCVSLHYISVFQHDEDISLALNECIIPSSEKVEAAMLDVVKNAIKKENAYTSGGEPVHYFQMEGDMPSKDDFSIPFSSVAKRNGSSLVCNYEVKVGDFCTLKGISSRDVTYTNDGDSASFIEVDMPSLKDSNGKTRLFSFPDGRKYTRKYFEFNTSTYGWGDISPFKLISDKIKKEHKSYAKRSIDDIINNCKQTADLKKTISSPVRDAPPPERT